MIKTAYICRKIQRYIYVYRYPLSSTTTTHGSTKIMAPSTPARRERHIYTGRAEKYSYKRPQRGIREIKT